MEDALLGRIFQRLGYMQSDPRNFLAVSPARVPGTDWQERFGHSKRCLRCGPYRQRVVSRLMSGGRC